MTKDHKMTPHEHVADARVVPSYELDTLGAPFRITLINSVMQTVDPVTGEEEIEIPDIVGLTLAVVRCRVMDPRKLSGDEIRFLRKAIGVPANKLSAFLDCSPEHYSRCEAGLKVLSPNAERQLRLFAFGATLCNDPESLLDLTGRREAPKPRNRKAVEKLSNFFFNVFMKMKIESVRSAEDAAIEYEFVRCADAEDGCEGPDCDGDGDWESLPLAVADAA